MARTDREALFNCRVLGSIFNRYLCFVLYFLDEIGTIPCWFVEIKNRRSPLCDGTCVELLIVPETANEMTWMRNELSWRC